MDGREDARQGISAPHFNTRANRDDALRLLRMASSDDVSYERLAKAIQECPGIPFAFIRAANSALLGPGREVRSLQLALALLGLVRIRTVLAEQVEIAGEPQRQRVAG